MSVSSNHGTISGKVVSPIAEYRLLMALAALMGGYVGAALAYRLPAGPLRAFIVASGLVMAAVFFLR